MSFFPMPSSKSRGDYVVFTDESSITSSNFMVIGGVLCRTDAANEIATEIQHMRSKHPFKSDSIQWKHINNRKIPIYKSFIDIALEHIHAKTLDFGCIVFKCSDINHRLHNDGDGEKGFSKFLYQWNMRCAKTYPTQSTIKIVHGYRETSQPLSNLTRELNAQCFQQFWEPDNQHCRFPDAKYAFVEKCELLQIADLFIGAVAHTWNDRNLRNPGSAKETVASYIQSECPAKSLGTRTYYSMRHFWIWPFKLKGGLED